jgi:hypothetical protein
VLEHAIRDTFRLPPSKCFLFVIMLFASGFYFLFDPDTPLMMRADEYENREQALL